MRYDTVIIGSGPAGLTAAIYLARSGYKVLILEKEGIGGQIASSLLVENYPGYASISGADLVNNMFDQVNDLGVDIEVEEALKIETGESKTVVTDMNRYKTKTVIIATGSKHRVLGLPNEDKFIGNTIHFCASCDAPFYKDKDVAVIGGGNSAISNALNLADIAKKVYIIQNLNELTGEQSLIDKIKNKENIEISYNATILDYLGEEKFEGIKISTDGKEQTIIIDGVFLAIGQEPQTELVKNLLNTNEYNYIISEDGLTEQDGIFVAGDCRAKEVKQLTTATADGTIAAIQAIKYLKNN